MPRVRFIEPRLHVTDLARAVAFYTNNLGFRVGTLFPDDRPTFALLRRDNVGLQLVQADSPAGGPPGGCTLWVDVEGVVPMHNDLRQRVTIEWGPEVFFYGRREFAVRDPDGHLIVLSEETSDPPTCPDE